MLLSEAFRGRWIHRAHPNKRDAPMKMRQRRLETQQQERGRGPHQRGPQTGRGFSRSAQSEAVLRAQLHCLGELIA